MSLAMMAFLKCFALCLAMSFAWFGLSIAGNANKPLVEAEFVFINKLNAKTTRIKVASQKPVVVDDKYKLELKSCVLEVVEGARTFVAQIKLTDTLEDAINFEGKIYSDTIYKQPVQNKFIAVNLVSCTHDSAKPV